MCKANVPSVKKPSAWSETTVNAPTTAHWYPGLPAKQWHMGRHRIVNTLAESYVTISASPGGAACRACRGQEIIEILVSSKLTRLPTSGSADSWTYKLHRHFISRRAGAQTDRCISRLARNHAPLSTSLTGGPALQFASVQGNLLFLTPRIFTSGGEKRKK